MNKQTTNRKYLFVCGCARSGTGALTRLLSTSRQIAIGLERFGHRIDPQDFTLHPGLFEKERFFSVQEGDTFYEDLNFGKAYYDLLRSKYDKCEYVGDKRPELYRSYQQLFENFPDCTVLFIYRNIFDVAMSFKKRSDDGSWPRDRGVGTAIAEWNESLAATLGLLGQKNIFCVRYEELFSGREVDVTPVFEAIGTVPTQNVFRVFAEKLSKKASILESERISKLDLEEKRHICLAADFDAYRRLDNSGHVVSFVLNKSRASSA